MGGFGIGCTEFVAMGLLPQLAADLLPDVYAESSERAMSQAGMLISAYALGVVVGAPTIAAAAARWPRKRLLLTLLVAFPVGTIGSALLPTFSLVLVARFVAALPHGAYFGIASLVAADLMGPGKRGKGVAFVLSGLTIANVVGVPAITWVGQVAGWRSAYAVVAALFALTVVAVQVLVPHQPGNPAATMRNELRAFGRLQVWMTLLVGAIGFGGLFAMYTYISPLSTEVTGLPLSAVPWILVVIGLGMTVGNLVGGWAADRNVRRALVVFFVGVGVSLMGLALTASTLAGLITFTFLAAAFSAAASPAIQTRLMDVARESQTIAAALNHSALNIGNSIGAALGGVTIAASLGYLSPIWVGVGLTAAGVILTLASIGIDRARGTLYPVYRESTEPGAREIPITVA
ncbi:MFS transporter [Rathayibacter iranicus]|uniref:MFS transporter n=2 Tax=Rathayibacter iranicus TaxID=59737 RepID=A0AAD1AHF5_9MICO|nr:MFS transporter [Rathayibacter iranicus]AZZ57385.1 MFS transporter [Rathayibacter iranicus]MWV32106.1 MFS transporter [Rathayibacter iranicus NCPPB 2253 = VKM Ac-1602]PPI47707.1 MFS transporter [Rathayibacter iranicus]PPI60625.1 MFS transporter [Rathayibacter iranicus]PPI73237.1 MFS transporter [Rathayibacter iranicus]